MGTPWKESVLGSEGWTVLGFSFSLCTVFYPWDDGCLSHLSLQGLPSALPQSSRGRSWPVTLSAISHKSLPVPWELWRTPVPPSDGFQKPSGPDRFLIRVGMGEPLICPSCRAADWLYSPLPRHQLCLLSPGAPGCPWRQQRQRELPELTNEWRGGAAASFQGLHLQLP